MKKADVVDAVRFGLVTPGISAMVTMALAAEADAADGAAGRDMVCSATNRHSDGLIVGICPTKFENSTVVSDG